MIEFLAWPKTPRLFRDCVITEKLDGTNAAIGIEVVPLGTINDLPAAYGGLHHVGDSGEIDGTIAVYAQSRNRIITPEADNYGFAAWVYENVETLIKDLGLGLHYGEWWGKGIQRGYSMDARWFSLFNTSKYEPLRFDPGFQTPGLDVVPILAQQTFSTELVDEALTDLRERGSHASLGFMRPEGVCVYHVAARQVFKALLENDDKPKGVAA